MQAWQAHGRSVVSLAFAPVGTTLATAADDEPGVRIWDLAAGAVQRELALFKETATCLAFSPDGKMLAAGRPWSIELWDPATGDQRLILEGHRHFSASLAFAPEGGALLSAGRRLGGHWDGAAQAVIWDLTDGKVTAEFVGPASDRLGLTRALDATTALWVRPGPTQKADPVVTITDVPTGRPRVLFDTPGPPRDAVLSPEGQTLAAAVRGDVVLWSLAEVAPLATTPQPTGWRRWVNRPARPSVPPLAPRLALSAGAERIDALAFTPDGRRLLAGSAAGKVRLWDVPELASGVASAPRELAPRAVYEWGIGPVTAVAVAADGLTAAAGGGNGRVVVWDVEG
jgi:WD40 repeat protein